jgi:periplasmic protein TonB
MLFSATNSSTTPHTHTKALFRTSALAGSVLVWGCLGYFTLTYAPKLMRTPENIENIILASPDPKEIPTPPPPKPEPIKQPNTIASAQAAPSATPSPPLTIRTPSSNLSNPLEGELPAGDAPSEPALVIGAGSAAISAIIETPIEAVKPIEIEPAVAPPRPQIVINPVRISGNNPVFPPRALEREIAGEVTLSFTVSATGKVENVNVSGETPRGYGFARAAQEAIAGWRFEPQTIDGIAVAYPARYTFSFTLTD